MEKDYSFIKYLYDEDLYKILPPKKPETVTFRGIVIFVEYPGIVSLPTKEKLLLNKILDAVQLKQVQVRIVNIHEIRNRLSTGTNVKFENAKAVFFTGKLPAMIRIPDMAEMYNIHQSEGNEFVLADPLEIIDQDKSLKKELWEVLQKLFPVA